MGIFERKQQLDEHGRAYWTARTLAEILGYEDYAAFERVIERARMACSNSGQPVGDHFAPFQSYALNETGERIPQENMKLSRYACYMTVQNADPSREIVAKGQSYFALQARKQEVLETHHQYIEDQRRLEARKEMSEHTKKLFSTARKAGVNDYREFQNAGYEGLYGGMNKQDIAAKKKLQPKDNMYDYMNSEELGSNLFRTTQTDAKLKRELLKKGVLGQKKAVETHYEVGKKVRETIQELDGTMPEKLPPVEHIKYARKRLKSLSYEVPAEVLEEQEKRMYFALPEDIDVINSVVSIIEGHKGEHVVQIGQNHFHVDEDGLHLLHDLLG